MAKDRQNRYATASEFKNDVLTYMNGGVPVAAAFNPLTDLSNMKARRDAERDLPTTALGQPQQPTQAFNPVTGQFEQISATNGTNAANVKSRAEQRAAAAKAKKRKRIIIGVVVALIAVIAIVVGVAFAMNGSHTSTEELVAIPECTASTSKDGMDAKLKAAGLTMVEKRDTDSTEPEGTCTRMSPKAGTKVVKGSKVQVWFSAGPQSISIPDVSKRTQDEARNILKDAGFEVNSVVKTEDSDSVAKDLVTRTDPANGQSATKGSSITLWVSTGMTKVPDNLVGQAKDAVLQQYNDKFNFTVESENSDSVPAGSITRVEPGSGSSIEQGGTITIWVSAGKKQATVPTIAAGTNYATAKLTLEAAGFTVQVSGPSDNNAVVVSTNPAGGSQVDEGSTVTITTKAGASSNTNNSSGGNTNTTE